ncbi:hypothetical protein [Streptomyces hainanensis]|uniref:hypothetical protein n=1 Tax=Streptomyces hainanensis TaxID=402648 RepID=UPI003C7C6EB7
MPSTLADGPAECSPDVGGVQDRADVGGEDEDEDEEAPIRCTAVGSARVVPGRLPHLTDVVGPNGSGQLARGDPGQDFVDRGLVECGEAADGEEGPTSHRRLLLVR